MCLLWLPPETRRRQTLHKYTVRFSTLRVTTDTCPVHYYMVPPSVRKTPGPLNVWLKRMKYLHYFINLGQKSYLSSVSRAATLACSASWSSCCSSKSRRTFRRTPSRRSTSPSLSSTWRFKAFTRRDSWGLEREGKRQWGVRGEKRRSQVKKWTEGRVNGCVNS